MYRVRDIDADIYMDCHDANSPEEAVMQAVMDFAITFPNAENFFLDVEEDNYTVGQYEAKVEVRRIVTCKEIE